MSGLIDSVNKVWILRTPRGELNLHGAKDNTDALLHLVRCVASEACTKETKFAFSPEAMQRILNLVETELSKCLEDE